MYYDFNNKNIIQGILMSWTSEAAKGLGWNIIGLLAIVSWTGINCFFMFFTLKKMGQLRVEPEQEFKGECILTYFKSEAQIPVDSFFVKFFKYYNYSFPVLNKFSQMYF